jgi:hypothetical protein
MCWTTATFAYTHRHCRSDQAPTWTYNGINAADVAVTITDNDASGKSSRRRPV